MKHRETHSLHIIGTQDREKLITSIADALSTILSDDVSYEVVSYEYFANGECAPKLHQSVRGKHVYAVIDTNSHSVAGGSANDRYMFGKLLMDDAAQYGAKTVNAIYPTFPYARADKPVHLGNKQQHVRKPSSARRVMMETESLGTDYLLTLDIHNPATLEIARTMKTVDLPTGWLIKKYIEEYFADTENIVLCGADQGGEKKIDAIAADLGIMHALAYKKRDHSQPNKVDHIGVVGDIKDKDVIIHDDMIDTAGTMVKLLETIHQHQQQPRSVSLVITHGMLNGPALDRLQSAYDQGLFSRLVITDSVYHESYPEYIEVIPTGPLFADKIASIAQGESIDYNRYSA